MAGVNQSTSGGTNETTEGQNALDMDASEINKFTGESYEDGKVITTQTPKTGKEVAAKPQTPSQKAAAAATVARVDEPDDDEDEGTHKPSKDEHRQTTQQRINIAVGKQRQAERDRDAANASFKALEARLAKLESGSTPAQQAGAAKVKDPNKEPQAADYEFGEADIGYIKDLTRYETRKELGDIKTEEKKQELTAAQQQANAAAQKAMDKFFAAGATKFGENYKEMVSSEDFKITPQLVKLMLDSDNGVDIAFDIASDEKLAAKVSALAGDPDKQAAWFGAYEAQHYSSDTADADVEDDEDDVPTPKATSKPASKAPKPPVHKNRGGGSSEAASASTSDFAAFERMATAKR